MPKFMKVATTDELEDQQAKLVEVEGQKIALFRVGEAFHALSNTCTHRGGPLSEGTVEGAEVTCPWHDPEGEDPCAFRRVEDGTLVLVGLGEF